MAGLRLVRVVGSGGEGEVWEVRDGDGRRRALKLVRPEALAEPDAVRRRGAWLRRIDHPSLVRVWRTGILAGGALDGWGLVEMDFVDGVPLDRAPPDPHALDRLVPLAEALDLLHVGVWSDGVPLVHRDVKPANLLDTGERLVLVDPSTLRGADATRMTRIGTPVFAAPEVVTGRIGPAADVYGFAATAVALLTGRRGEKLAELLDDDALRELPLTDGVRAALSARPDQRPVSCRAALEGPVVRLGPRPAPALPAATAPPRVFSRETRDLAGFREKPADGGADGPAADAGVDSPGPREAREAEPPPRAGTSAWVWMGVLTLLTALPVAAWAAGTLRGGRLSAAVVVVVTVHVVAHGIARGRVAAALLLGPLAWAFLLADRVLAPPPRRDWLRTATAGAIACASVAAVRIADAGSVPVAAAAALVGLVGVAAALAGVGARGASGRALRLALLPAWGVGAALLVAGAIVCLVPGAVAGRVRRLLRFARRTLASAAEATRPA